MTAPPFCFPVRALLHRAVQTGFIRFRTARIKRTVGYSITQNRRRLHPVCNLRGKQCFRVRVARSAQDRAGCTRLQHPPAAQNQHPVTACGDGNIMRDNELRRVRENGVQKRKKLRSPGFVQSIRRLIGDEQPCPRARRQRDCHALRHAAGKLEGILVQNRLRRVKACQTQLFCRQCQEFFARQTELFQAVIELLPHRARRKQKLRAVLRNIHELVAAQCLQMSPCGKLCAVHLDVAAPHLHVRREKSQNGQRQHRFARAGFPDDCQPFPGRNREGNVS